MRVTIFSVAGLIFFAWAWAAAQSAPQRELGQEIAVPIHFSEEDLVRRSLAEIVAQGKLLFSANWTEQEGAGRPLMKGTTRSLVDPSQPLSGLRAFNRFSAPDANSCAGCHNLPYGISGGGGDFVTNVFVLGQRFDFLNFDKNNKRPTSASFDETGTPVDLMSAANIRATT